MTCLDLSPFYLEKARENMDYWRRMRAPASQKNTSDNFIQVGRQMLATLVHLAGWLLCACKKGLDDRVIAEILQVVQC